MGATQDFERAVAHWSPPRNRLADAIKEAVGDLPLEEVHRYARRIRATPDYDAALDLMDRAIEEGGKRWDRYEDVMVWKGVLLNEAGRHEECVRWVEAFYGKNVGYLGSDPYFPSLAHVEGVEAAMARLDRARGEGKVDDSEYEMHAIHILEVAGPSPDLTSARERLEAMKGPFSWVSRLRAPESWSWLFVWATPVLMALLLMETLSRGPTPRAVLPIAVLAAHVLAAVVALFVSGWVTCRLVRFHRWRRRLDGIGALRRLADDRRRAIASTMASA